MTKHSPKIYKHITQTGEVVYIKLLNYSGKLFRVAQLVE